MTEADISTNDNASLTYAPILYNSSSTTVVPLQRNEDMWRIGLFGVGGACIACVGVVCNIIAIIVLAHYKVSRTTSSAPCLLISLEVFDTTFLLSELFLENIAYMAKGGFIDRSYRTFIAPIYCIAYPVPHIARACATFLVVVITLERCIVVVWPLSAHRICRSTNAKLAVLVVTLGALLYHIPLYMAYTCSREWNNATQTEVTRFRRSEFGSNYYFTNVHMTWIKLCVNFLIPFVFLLVFNTLLLTALWRSKASLFDESQRRAIREKKLTAMVVCMTGVFFLCEIMSAVTFILTSGLNSFVECSPACNRFTAVADTLVIVNSASSFAIYCVSGRKFRDIFAQLFLRRRGHIFSSRSSGSARSSTTTRKRLVNFFKSSEDVQSSILPSDVKPSTSTPASQLQMSLLPRSPVTHLNSKVL